MFLNDNDFRTQSTHLSFSCLKYLVNYHIVNNLNLYGNLEPSTINYSVIYHVLATRTFEEIKYVLETVVSNNFLNIEYFENKSLIFVVIERNDEELIKYFVNFCIQQSISFTCAHVYTHIHRTRFGIPIDPIIETPISSICKTYNFQTIKWIVDICTENKIDIYQTANHDLTNGCMYRVFCSTLCSNNPNTPIFIMSIFERHGLLSKYKNKNGDPLLDIVHKFGGFSVLKWIVEHWIANNFELEIVDLEGSTLLVMSA